MNTILATTAILSLSGAALGVVVADESQYIDRPDGAAVGRLGGGSCVPIGARFALTADHVGARSGTRILLDGQYYTVKSIYRHPEAPSVDLKVLEIEGASFTTWVDVHEDPLGIAYGSPVYIGGWGKTSTEIDGTCVEWGARFERWAMNDIEGRLGGIWSWYRFDIEVPNEGIAAVYDSGSPMMIVDDGGCSVSLVGVATSATSGAAGPSCDNHTAHYVNVDPLWLSQFVGPACLGDFDNDADTDVLDFAFLVSNFGAVTDTEDCVAAPGDLNEDGVIGVDDVAIFINNFGCIAN